MNQVTGSALRKVDLHIHTPKSTCYSDKSVTMEQIVTGALASGLEAVAITDHNTAEAIDDIRQIAREKGLCIFPGVELTTKGGHVVALFELDSPTKKLEDFINDVGVDQGGKGDGGVLTGDATEEVFQKIAERGGLAIAAHIERWPSGFLETNEPRRVKMRIHASSYLSALEITVPQNKRLWNTGQMPGYPKPYACIQSSDAHALADIGRRPVYIQMAEVSLEAMRSAFLDYEAKILFPDEVPLGQ